MTRVGTVCAIGSVQENKHVQQGFLHPAISAFPVLQLYKVQHAAALLRENPARVLRYSNLRHGYGHIPSEPEDVLGDLRAGPLRGDGHSAAAACVQTGGAMRGFLVFVCGLNDKIHIL